MSCSRLLPSVFQGKPVSAWVLLAVAVAGLLGMARAEGFRETTLLDGEWFVLGLEPDVQPEVPDTWFLRIPKQATPVQWPGPMSLSAGESPSSLTLLFWKPIEAPRRWLGKGVWLNIPALEGPTRIYFNGTRIGGDDPAGGAGIEVGLTPYLVPGESHLLVLEVQGSGAARRMMRGDPPNLLAAAPLHLTQMRARPTTDTGVLWVDVGFADQIPAGAVRPPEKTESDGYSVDFEVREGPEEDNGPVVPSATLRSYRLDRAQRSVTAPLPVEERRRWSLQSPSLYSVSATLRRNDKPVDRLTVTTGFARWQIQSGRLQLDGRNLPLFAVTLPVGLIRFAEEGAWAEVSASSAGFKRTDPDMFLTLVARRRRIFWQDVLGRLKRIGIDLVRSGDRLPPSVLEAADRVGMIVEQRVEPHPRRLDPRTGGGVSSAYVVADAVGRDQYHPSLAFWRLETRESAGQLDALVRALSVLDATRPVFGFLRGDARVHHPGILRRQGEPLPEPVIETNAIPESTSLVRTWEIYSRLADPGKPLPVSVAWNWAPEVADLEPDTVRIVTERLLMARANPTAAGIGFALAMPPWGRQGVPPPTRTPPADEILWVFRDSDTSQTVANALQQPGLLISPGVQVLVAGKVQTVEVAVLLSPWEPPPERANLTLTLRPPNHRGDAFPPCAIERSLPLREFAGDSSVVRAGIEVDVSEGLPPGPAILEARVEWPGRTLQTAPHPVTIQKKR